MGPIEEHVTPLPGARARAGRGRRRGRSGALAIGLLVALALTGCLPVAPPTPTIAVYGDSLVAESVTHLEAALRAALPGWNVLVRSAGGVAQCDYHSQMVSDADHHNVRAVVLAFSGNNFTPCSVARPYPDSYYFDANWAVFTYRSRGVALGFVAAPGPVGTAPADRIVPNVYRYVGTERGIPVGESDLLLDPATGTYESDAPCLVDESCDWIDVRAPDGGHLCPVLLSAPCAVYSSGVVRYSDAIVRIAAGLAGFAPPAALTLVTPPSTTTTSTSTTSTTTSTTMASLAPGSVTGGAPVPGSVLAPGVVYPTARPGAPYSPLGDLAPGR